MSQVQTRTNGASGSSGANGSGGRGRKLTYHIGTVANLTGLNPDTIRAWERRYEAIVPKRSEGGSRLYDDEDLERLQLLKAVTESGEPIGTIAGHTDEELRELLARIAGLSATDAHPAPAMGEGTLRLAVLSDRVTRQLETSPSKLGRFELVLETDDAETYLAEIAAGRPELLLLDLDALGDDPLDVIDRCVAATATDMVAVLYNYAHRDDLVALSERGVKLIQGPVNLDQLGRSLFDLFVIEKAARQRVPGLDGEDGEDWTEAAPPPRRFSDQQLARLLEIDSAIDCECPNHLAGIITKLAAFETYSRACESREPEDAELHASLARGTAQARTLMERLLLRVCEQDGIEL